MCRILLRFCASKTQRAKLLDGLHSSQVNTGTSIGKERFATLSHFYNVRNLLLFLGTRFNSHLPNLLLSDRHWQTEILVSSLFWSFNDWTHETNVSRRMHLWNTPIYLGMALIKCETLEKYEIKIESLLDTLQLEWSVALAEYVLLAIR